MSSNQSSFGQRLHLERELHHWSQKQLALKIRSFVDLDPNLQTVSIIQNINHWEKDKTFPHPHYLEKLENIFAKGREKWGEDVSQRELIWNVPYRRNPFFTGRQDVLERLHDALHASKAAALTQSQALSGLGGIGKTQSATEYAYRHAKEYQAVLWARADTRDTLSADFVTFANMLNLPEKKERNQDRVVEAVKHWLHTHSDWLLILDNVENLTVVEDFTPADCHGHILLTTCAQSTGTFAQRIDLEQMESAEGALFLLRRAKLLPPATPLEDARRPDITAAKTISQIMDGLPLALDQAAAYIEETGCSLSDYLDRYQCEHARLLDRRSGGHSDHPHSVGATLSLSFLKVEQTNPAAADLLRLCAFLHPDAIPEELLIAGPTFQSIAADPSFQLDIALTALRTYSLLRRNPETKSFTIHRLVQAVLKDRMDEYTERQWAEQTVKAVNAVFPNGIAAETWAQCQRCFPQAQVCASLIKRWQIITPEAARLLNETGYYLYAHAQFLEATSLYQQALTIYEQALGEDHPNTAGCLTNLAILYRDQGNYGLAEPLFQQALTIRQKVLGEDHLETAKSLNNLAILFFYQGKYELAELFFQQALAIREHALGENHPETATSLNNLATIYTELGKYVQAEPLLHRAIAIQEQVLGAEHPETAGSLTNLGILYRTQGKYVQAEPLYQRALAIRKKVFGARHPQTADSLHNLALIYYDQGKYELAEPLFQQALKIRKKVFGSEHRCTLDGQNDLALLYHAQGKTVQATRLLQRVLAIQEKVLDAAHPEMASTLHNLGRFYHDQGNYEQAERFYQRALTIRKQVLGEEHPDTVKSRNDLVNLYRDLGQYRST